MSNYNFVWAYKIIQGFSAGAPHAKLCYGFLNSWTLERWHCQLHHFFSSLCWEVNRTRVKIYCQDPNAIESTFAGMSPSKTGEMISPPRRHETEPSTPCLHSMLSPRWSWENKHSILHLGRTFGPTYFGRLLLHNLLDLRLWEIAFLVEPRVQCRPRVIL